MAIGSDQIEELKKEGYREGRGGGKGPWSDSKGPQRTEKRLRNSRVPKTI